MTLHPLEERFEFPEIILRSHTSREQDVYGFLANIKVLRTAANHLTHVRGSALRAGVPFRDADRRDAWR